jgi:hypothetical protein
MSLTYGYDLKDGDKILEAPTGAAEKLSPLRLLLPGGALVNHLPFCAISNFILPIIVVSHSYVLVRHIPSWVPFLSYEPFARTVRKLSERIRNEPIDFVKNALVCGDRAPSILVD